MRPKVAAGVCGVNLHRKASGLLRACSLSSSALVEFAGPVIHRSDWSKSGVCRRMTRTSPTVFLRASTTTRPRTTFQALSCSCCCLGSRCASRLVLPGDLQIRVRDGTVATTMVVLAIVMPTTFMFARVAAAIAGMFAAMVVMTAHAAAVGGGAEATVSAQTLGTSVEIVARQLQ